MAQEMTMKTETETQAPAGKPTPETREPETLPVGKLPGGLRRLLRETPQKEWYRIKALRAKYEEAIDLIGLAPTVDYLLDVAPGKLVAQLRKGTLTPQALDGAFRTLRESISGVKEACRSVAKLAQMELRSLAEDDDPVEGPGPSPPETPAG